MTFVVGDRVRHRADLTDIPGTVRLVLHDDKGGGYCYVDWDARPDPLDTPYGFSILTHDREITPA
jgi:hypothetical protein